MSEPIPFLAPSPEAQAPDAELWARCISTALATGMVVSALRQLLAVFAAAGLAAPQGLAASCYYAEQAERAIGTLRYPIVLVDKPVQQPETVAPDAAPVKAITNTGNQNVCVGGVKLRPGETYCLDHDVPQALGGIS